MSESDGNFKQKIFFLDKLIATGFASGYFPIAPGTAGSLVGLAFYFIPGFQKPYVILPAATVFFFWGTYTAGKMERVWGHDPSRVVIDEVVGMWVSIAFLPKRFLVAAAAFLIFRMIDIFKPFPANYFDNKNGGYAIMMDDIVSGVYTNIIMQLWIYLAK